MRIGAVLAAALVTVAAGLVLVLLDSGQRQAGTNYVPELGVAATIEASGSHCEQDQLIPADAAVLRLPVGTAGEPTPELRVSVRSDGETIASAEVPARRSGGHALIPMGPFEERREGAEVCIAVRERGVGRPAVLRGTPGHVRFEWLRAGQETWLDLIPTVAHRFGLGKPFLSGPWALWLAAALLAFAWLIALRLAARELGR